MITVKKIKDFPEYEVDILGNISRDGKVLKPQGGKESLTVCLSRKGEVVRKSIHRLVADAFLPNPKGHKIIHHKDKDARNNMVVNLEWCDKKAHAKYHKADRRARKVIYMEDEKYNRLRSKLISNRTTVTQWANDEADKFLQEENGHETRKRKKGLRQIFRSK